MNYVFFGNNVPLAERLRKALGTGGHRMYNASADEKHASSCRGNGLLCIHREKQILR